MVHFIADRPLRGDSPHGKEVSFVENRTRFTRSQWIPSLGRAIDSLRKYLSAEPLKPVIDMIKPFVAIVNAYRLMKSNTNTGKIVVVVD